MFLGAGAAGREGQDGQGAELDEPLQFFDDKMVLFRGTLGFLAGHSLAGLGLDGLHWFPDNLLTLWARAACS